MGDEEQVAHHWMSLIDLFPPWKRSKKSKCRRMPAGLTHNPYFSSKNFNDALLQNHLVTGETTAMWWMFIPWFAIVNKLVRLRQLLGVSDVCILRIFFFVIMQHINLRLFSNNMVTGGLIYRASAEYG